MMRYPVLPCLTLATIAAAGSTQCPLVKDINTVLTPFDSDPITGRVGEGSTFADGMLKCGTHWYFVASTTATGQELWKTDGTAAGTVLVRDIYPGANGSEPFWLTCCNGKVFFQAKTAASGIELWVSDGTASGTVMVKDVNAGAAASFPTSLCCLGKKVLFTATNGSSGYELWITDGTANGTTMLKDIWPGSRSGGPRYMKRSLLGKVYFHADDGTNGGELWVTDGTASGTKLLKDIRSGSGSSLPANFVDNPSNPLETLFRADDGVKGFELWKTDGTAKGTVLVKDIRPGSASSGPDMYHSPHSVVNGSIYFGADDGTHGNELWKTNGTAAGTVLVKDINPGVFHSDPDMFRASASTLYMQACTSTEGCELFKLVGTTVSLVKDIQRGVADSSPSFITRLSSGNIVFAADTGSADKGKELWISDGTSKGTKLLKDIFAGADSSEPSGLTPIMAGGKAMFFAEDGSSGGPGREVYETDGTASGTKLLKDVNPGSQSNSSSPNFVTSSRGSVVYFAADDGRVGRELWKADASGVSLLKDIRSGTESSALSGFIDLWTGSRHITLFRADDGKSGTELWATDGTTAGTTLVKDIAKGRDSSKPNNFGRLGNRVYFSAWTAATGYELWATDGTAAGTVMIKDIDPGTGSSFPYRFAAFKGELYFVANQRSSTGSELWKTDGTANGTVLVKDILVGSRGSSPLYLTPFGNVLLFQANDLWNGVELWKTDGTTKGTVMVKDIAPGSYGGHPTSLTPFGGAVYFVATTSASGTELWKTDGTATGTVMVKDIQVGSSSGRPGNLTVSQGKLFLTANSGLTGTELFVSNGTAAGTVMVKDIRSGPLGSSPIYLTAAGDGIYFSADDGTTGRELYFSDGTAAGTARICDLNPGAASSYPAPTICDGVLYLRADDGTHGFEMFRLGARAATVERIGIGCGANAPTLDSTQPVLGKNCTLSGTGPATGSRLLIVGLPSAPFRIAGLVAPDCAIWENLAASVVLPLPAGGSWTLQLRVPSQTSTIGARVTLQSAHEPMPLSMSNALQITAGR